MLDNTTSLMDYNVTSLQVPGVEETVASSCQVQTVLYSLIGCIGILDNGFVLYVILSYKPMRKQLNNMYIINQSIVDLCSSVIMLCVIPLCDYTRIIGPHSNMVAEEIYCRVWQNLLLFWCFVLTSTYNLVVLTLDRYFSVVHAIKYKSLISRKLIGMALGLAWMLGFGITIPWAVLTSGLVDGVCWVWGIYPDDYSAYIAGIINLFISFLMPALVLLVCYTWMAWIISKQARIKTTITNVSQSEHNRNQKLAKVKLNIIKTMATVSLLFFLCWGPNSIWYVVLTAGVPLSTTNALYHFCVYTTNINCLVNPFIYLLGYKQFQKAVRVVILKRSDGDSMTGASTVGTVVV